MAEILNGHLGLLHVVPTYLPATRYGGPIYSVHGLCKALARLGHEVDVMTTNVDGDSNSDVPLGVPVWLDGVRVTYFASQRLRRLYWSPPMRPALKHAVPRASVVHLHSVFLWPTSAAARVAQAAQVPYVVAPRGMLVPELLQRKSPVIKAAWLALVERRTLAGAARLHVTTEAEYRDACRVGLPLPAPCIVPNGVDFPNAPEQIEPSAHLAHAMQRGPYAIFVGRLNWKKGLDRLFAALAGTNIRLLVAGNDEERYLPTLESLARDHGLGERVEFLGHVGGDDKWSLMHRARFLVLPSYNENFGNVVVEAMGVGCPVVVTPEVGAAEIVQRSQGGIVVSGEPLVLRGALQRLWSDDDARAQMGHAASVFVRAHLTWDASALSMAQCYRQLLTSAPVR
jgi:glycosyltransferase involved in cell wall biosynthesis